MRIQVTFELFERIDLALKKAIKNALLQHKQAGRSIHILVEGSLVEVPAEKINVDEEPIEGSI